MNFKKIVKEARKPVKKSQRKQQWWFDIPGAKYYYHGDWADPEVVYKGFSLNYWDIQEGLYEIWKEENPDGNENDFDQWFEQQGGAGGVIEGELDNCVYACLGDDGVDWDNEWLGIPDAYKVKEVSGQGDGDFVLYHDCLVDISEFEYYDEEYDDWYPYSDSPEKFEAYYGIPDNKTELVTRLKESIMMYRDKSLMDESWLGDKMKAGWEKVKTGAKKVGKAIGDVFNGPFRKGDHIVMKGEDGEEFKGTIKRFDLDDKTYEVILGNPVNEGLQEDVLDMSDREDELVWMIQEKFWDLAD